MPKAYWISTYRSVNDADKLAAYGITVVSAAGFAPHGVIPWHSVIAFAVGAVLVAVQPRRES